MSQEQRTRETILGDAIKKYIIELRKYRATLPSDPEKRSVMEEKKYRMVKQAYGNLLALERYYAQNVESAGQEFNLIHERLEKSNALTEKVDKSLFMILFEWLGLVSGNSLGRIIRKQAKLPESEARTELGGEKIAREVGEKKRKTVTVDTSKNTQLKGEREMLEEIRPHVDKLSKKQQTEFAYISADIKKNLGHHAAAKESKKSHRGTVREYRYLSYKRRILVQRMEEMEQKEGYSRDPTYITTQNQHNLVEKRHEVLSKDLDIMSDKLAEPLAQIQTHRKALSRLLEAVEAVKTGKETSKPEETLPIEESSSLRMG